jgi:hypothetical protein
VLNQDVLAAYFDGTLSPAERGRVDLEIATDSASHRVLANQQLLDQALRVALGGSDGDERVKRSVLAVVRASSVEELRAQVLADTSALRTARRSSPAAMPAGANNGGPNPQLTGPWPRLRAQVATLFHFEFSVARFFGAAAALLAISLGIYLFHGRPKAVTQPNVGQFAIVVGTPTVRRSGERVRFEAGRTTQVRLGDHIETSDADRAEIQFRDGTTLRLHFNTVIEIASAKSLDSRSKTRTPTPLRPPEIALLRGQVWSKVQKLTNATPYAVRTPVATAVATGVRTA